MNKSLAALAGAGLGLLALRALRSSPSTLALIGDVGGTNVRLQLICGSVILKAHNYNS